MDFSYFTSAPQPYQFFGLPQTPSNTHTPQLDDFNPNSSNEQYDAAFAAFQQNFHYDPSTFLAQPHQQSAVSPPLETRHDSMMSISELDSKGMSDTVTELPLEEPGVGRSSSEEKDILTPQQSRRKAQNRAAQRAFRERKERHVKDLEAKLTTLQTQSSTLNGENERLRRELAKIATENEILRATSGAASNGPTPFLEEPDELVGPLGYVPTDFPVKMRSPASSLGSGAEAMSKYAHFGTMRTITIDDDTGEQLLGMGATWDYIQTHELFRKGLVDVGDVCERLKKMARCDGQGPIFLESDVRQAISESAVAGGRDELI
ncbi:AP-1-like transcription factor [Exophiala xenobiotica]